MEEHRLNPEKILRKLQEEERKSKRGKLKIYLGFAPGVGKTYTMLEDALEQRNQGLDVIIGIAESHGRREIELFLKKFEILPKQVVNYRGTQIVEFDLDAALKRRPALILVDEMAHTNAPGLRHAKRWQDIKELVDRGIDVYTTLNVQHLDSLNNAVSSILGTPVKETVPDFMLEQSDTIEVVDITPEELLKRLQEGKVYFSNQMELAKENFFRKGNLITLRELALRVTAERVGRQAFLYRQDLGIKQIWPIKEKILVCVSARPDSAKIIREANRIAKRLQTEWIAVHVNKPRLKSSKQQWNSAIQNLRLAEQLGAETKILTGFDVAKEIIHFAREQNIAQIIVGRKIRPRWQDFFSKSLAYEIVRDSREIDVYIITSPADQKQKQTKIETQKRPLPWKIYGLAIAAVIIATLINSAIYPFLHTSNLIMIYLLAVIFVALFSQIGPAILASILSVLAYDFFFVPLIYSFATSSLEYLFTLIIMLAIAQTISYLTLLLRQQSKAAQFAERQISALHTLSRQLASMRGVDQLLAIGINFIGNFFNSEIIALLPDTDHLVVHASYKTEQVLDAKEQAVIQWVYDLGQAAGLGTDTLSFSKALYMPLLASHGPIGVLRVCPIKQNILFTPEQTRLLEACCNQIALAIEVDQLQEIKMQNKLKIRTDYIRDTLLKSVSHDFRAPLVALMANASTVIEIGNQLDVKEIKNFGSKMYLESEQLSRLLNNLLQINYLESEKFNLHKELLSLNDVIIDVINMSSEKIGQRVIDLQLEDTLPKTLFDGTLIQEVIINLLDNALKFTSTGSYIKIVTSSQDNYLVFCIQDSGSGIQQDERDNLFKKYYRGRLLTSERGLGLGLAICRKIINLHNGKIWVENSFEGGAAFYFALPLLSL